MGCLLCIVCCFQGHTCLGLEVREDFRQRAVEPTHHEQNVKKAVVAHLRRKKQTDQMGKEDKETMNDGDNVWPRCRGCQSSSRTSGFLATTKSLKTKRMPMAASYFFRSSSAAAF